MFLRRLNRAHPRLAWVYTLERHRSGAWHVHVAVNQSFPNEREDRALARLWGHGFVDGGRRLKPPSGGVPAGRRELARSAARYVGKYLAKDPSSPPWAHRYEVRQGFQPEVVRTWHDSDREAWAHLVREQGGEVPGYQWESSTADGWRGPPVVFLSW
jgi:hypothetical protein